MKYFELNRTIQSLLPIPGQHRNRLVSAALAEAISQQLTIPSTRVDNVMEFYELNLRRSVADVVSDINESVLMDASETMRMVELLYRFRYGCVYPVLYQGTESALDYFCTRAGVNRYFAPEEFAWLTDNKNDLLQLAAVFSLAIYKDQSNLENGVAPAVSPVV